MHPIHTSAARRATGLARSLLFALMAFFSASAAIAHGANAGDIKLKPTRNLAKQLTSRSLPEIGRRFGNRDHTTVMHAVSRVASLMELDAAFAEDVELLRRMLES